MEVIEALVDYLRFTVKELPDSIELQKWESESSWVINAVLGLNSLDFKEAKGQYGYLRRLEHSGICVYDMGHEGMGILVQLSGKACRFYERVIEGFQWVNFLRMIKGNGYNISRLDIALDDFSGVLNIDNMKKCIEEGRLRSRFRNYLPVGARRIKDNAKESDTLNFGSRESQCFFRVYDKRLERLAKGLECEYEQWVRFELELKDERANAFVEELIRKENFGNIGHVASRVVTGYMRFVDFVGGEKNPSRLPNCQWWDNWLLNVEKLKLTKGKDINTVEGLNRWVEKSVAPTLKLLLEAYGSLRFLERLIDKAELSDKQRMILNEYKERTRRVANDD